MWGPPSRFLRLSYWLPRLALVALAAGAVALALPRASSPYLAAAGAGALGVAALAFLASRPAWLVPLIIATVPLEISKVFIPVLRAESPWGGYPVSILDLSRLVTLLAIAVWGLSSLAAGRLAVPRNWLVGLGFLLLPLYLVTLPFTPDPGRGQIEVVRLGFNLLLFLAVARFVSSGARLNQAVGALILTGFAMGVLAIYQYLTGHLFWNEQLMNQPIRRVNATFADPNSLAAFMNLVVAMCLALAAEGVRGVLARAALLGVAGVGLAGLVFSFSRAGWVAGAAILVLFVLWTLLSRRVVALGLAGAVGGAVVVLLTAVPAVSERVLMLTEPGALSVRPYLIEAGLMMFREHPLLGLGIGGYQRAALTDYAFINPYVWYVSASHTSLITIAAELGLAGLLLTGLICLSAAGQAWALARGEGVAPRHRAYAAGLLLGFVALFIAAQSMGIFYEEPYLWVLFGLLVALKRLEEGRRALGSAGLAHDRMGK